MVRFGAKKVETSPPFLLTLFQLQNSSQCPNYKSSGLKAPFGLFNFPSTKKFLKPLKLHYFWRTIA